MLALLKYSVLFTVGIAFGLLFGFVLGSERKGER